MTTARRPSTKTEPLLAKARAGDEHAWRELLERYQVMLLVKLELDMPGFLRRITSPEDVLQDAFVKVSREIGSFQYQGEGSFRRWLRRVVHNEMQNRLRAGNVEQNVLRPVSGDAVERLPHRDNTPSQILARISEKDQVLERMRELSEEDQDLISMRCFEDLSWEEIATGLGCCRETASQRFDRAIARLGRLVT